MTISADQIRQARKLLGWHRGDVAIRARHYRKHRRESRGRLSRFAAKPEQLQEIRGVLEAAGIEFTIGTPGVKLRRTGCSHAGLHVNEPSSENDNERCPLAVRGLTLENPSRDKEA